MGKDGLKSSSKSVYYRAICAQGDLPDSLYESEEEALEEVSKHQEQNPRHRVKVDVVQTD